MPADGPCGSLLELESCGGAGSRFSAIAADRKATRHGADGRYPLLNPDSGSQPTLLPLSFGESRRSARPQDGAQCLALGVPLVLHGIMNMLYFINAQIVVDLINIDVKI